VIAVRRRPQTCAVLVEAAVRNTIMQLARDVHLPGIRQKMLHQDAMDKGTD